MHDRVQHIDARIQQGQAVVQELYNNQRNLAEIADHQRSRAADLARLGLSWDSNLATTLNMLQSRLSLAGALLKLLEAIKPLELAETSWQHGLLAFQTLLSQRVGQVTVQSRQILSEHHKAWEALKSEYSRSSTALAQTLMKKHRLERELAEVREDETSLKRQWESLVGPNTPWLDENLDLFRSAHGKRLALTEQATVHLNTARHIREYEEGSRLIQNRRASLTALQDSLNKAQTLFHLANNVQSLLEQKIKSHTREQIESLRTVVSPLFARMQANRVFDRVQTGDNPLDWLGMVEDTVFTPNMHFSQGQRQDLALAIFLARARGLGGTFLLDEPLAHLDDLNRLALLDALRAMVVEDGSNLNIVITTANRALVKHLVQKFARVQLSRDTRPLRVYELTGNPRVGVQSTILV